MRRIVSNRCIVKLAGKVQITRNAYLVGSGGGGDNEFIE